MKTYARVEDSKVMELLTTDRVVSELFHPALVWREISSGTVQQGWVVQGNSYTAPPPDTVRAAPVNLAELQAQVTALAVRIAALHVQG